MDDQPTPPEEPTQPREPQPSDSQQGAASKEAPPKPEEPPTMAPSGSYERETSTSYPPGGAFSQPNPGYVNYPRYLPPSVGGGPVPPGPPVVRFEAIGDAWEIMRQDFASYAAISLLMLVILYGVYFVVAIPVQYFLIFPSVRPGEIFPSDPRAWLGQGILMVVSMTLSATLGAGYFNVCLRRLRGFQVSVGDLFTPLRFALPLLAAGVLTGILTTLGFFLLIIPGFLMMGLLSFVPMIIFDQRAGPIEAINISFQVLKKQALMMGLLVFVVALLAALGALACCIGVLFTLPFYYMTLALHYHAFFPPQGGPEQMPAYIPAPSYSV